MLVEQTLPVARNRLITINDTALLREVAMLLDNKHTHLVVVCGGDDTMVGIVSKTDVVRRISHCTGNTCTTDTAEVMTRDVTYCRPNDLLQDVWSTMKELDFLSLPIVDHDFRPLGVLNARDALHALLTQVEHQESLLRDYVMGVGYR